MRDGNRSLSQEEEIRRFSFGLDPDTFTEVEVCEKTFSFKISTDIRPLPGWSNSGNNNGKQPSSAFRRASLAVMSGCKFFSLDPFFCVCAHTIPLIEINKKIKIYFLYSS